MQKFKEISTSLIDEMILEERYRNHKLKGDYEGRYECHIEPDWLFI
jgi:mRNA interferase YafQ